MLNDKAKCGLLELKEGIFLDNHPKEAYVWYEKDWTHDDYEHKHHRAQLVYVEEGYQYFHVAHCTYLVPQHHVIWIPSGIAHRTTSEAKRVNLMTILFQPILTDDFYQQVHVFLAPPVLREMILYASKWNKLEGTNKEEDHFLRTILLTLPAVCEEALSLQIPIPKDERLHPVCRFINTNFGNTLAIDVLSELAHMSVRTLQRTFKKETGITLQKYIQLIRVLKSVELINTEQYTLTQVAHLVGYKSLSAFSLSYLTIMKSKPKHLKSS